MNFESILKLLDILSWPLVATLAIVVVRPYLSQILSGAKVKLSVAGQSIETTIPEIKEVVEENVADIEISELHIQFLRKLQVDGARQYENGVIDKEEREFLRPLRNAGLVASVPAHSRLTKIKTLKVSGLGRLYLR